MLDLAGLALVGLPNGLLKRETLLHPGLEERNLLLGHRWVGRWGHVLIFDLAEHHRRIEFHVLIACQIQTP